MATLHDYETYALMLRELGIEVAAADVTPDAADVAPPLPLPREPRNDFADEFEMQVGFEHMTHLVPHRPYAPYKRMTYFSQLLAQVTGRNGDEASMRPIISRLKRAGVKVGDEMAYFRIRRLLKKWGYTSPQYRQIFAMLKAMGGQVLKLTYGYEMRIRGDFSNLCRAFEKGGSLHGRKNFLSYFVVVQLLVKKYRLPCFYKLPSIKDTQKFQSLVDLYYKL
jgi:hypothetical protein